MAVGAIHAKRRGHMHHQCVGPFRSHGTLTIPSRQRRGADVADLLITQKEGGEGIRRQEDRPTEAAG